MIHIPLTTEQLATLAPLFAQLHDANVQGECDALGAQIYPDGMVATIISEASVRRIQAAVYGEWIDGTNRTAESRMAEKTVSQATIIRHRAHKIGFWASSEAVTAIKECRNRTGMGASAAINALILSGDIGD